eukprot:CAMPEP_0116999954 /NCGR_PEP_ID=MMETSP0472-20121206/2472_1 /TAXON_ID=693140 ORGANISM="Tiarina fusus, Strain LIS" /NCGR_SAMPLE_ID=MMETSP0472 /ASSEMBLY_ACC=CAM_ASM_000603 /LENGTH=414 /DNA_ID=CAMNT_0004699515 /DNA_START=129 /DNA_END=1374 /DNA_ORIENTATION=+
MIPINPPETYSSSRYMNHWIPSSVVFHRHRGQGPPRKRIRYTSSDELCAASVLISLSPKGEDSPPRHHHPECGRPEFPVSARQQPFKSYYNQWEHPQVHLNSRPALEIEPLATTAGGGGHISDAVSYTSEVSSAQSFDSAASTASESSCWYEGSTSLSLPEDDDVLSPLHCFMRRYCVEAFSATEEDVSTPRYGKSHGVKVVVGQVGIRCLYCKHRPTGKRPERAVCYPSSLQNIYHSIETWQRRHSLVCSYIPPWVRKSIVELMESSKSRAGGRRKYWEDSAKRLGMMDTSHGVRFSRTPGDLGPPESLPGTSSDALDTAPVVQDEDRELVTPYLFLLLEQMQTCQFTEEDRSGGRSKIKDNDTGFPGMQCKHCHGKAGFGRYFPTSANALALANSDETSITTSRNAGGALYT